MREFSRRPKCLRRLGTDPIAQYRHRRRDVPGAPPSTATDTLLFVSHTESDRRCVHRQEQFIQDVRIEGRDQGKRNVFSMMNDISFYEPILAMGAEIGCGAIEDKEDEIIIGLDLGRIASNFPPTPLQCPRPRAAIRKEMLRLVSISRGTASLELTPPRDGRWRGRKLVRSTINMARKSKEDHNARLALKEKLGANRMSRAPPAQLRSEEVYIAC